MRPKLPGQQNTGNPDDVINQPCATCKADYKVLRKEAHWRTLCHSCYLKAKKAECKAQAEAVTRLGLPKTNHAPRPAASCVAVDIAANVRRIREEARRDLIEQAAQPPTTLAGKVAYTRLRRILKDQRRIWQQRHVKPDGRRLRQAQEVDPETV